ncbi:MAG: AraC family transcriptional regulator [Phyllobacteriaceae bacterium]|nr:AraC family transcriptional regulator [Phyllobacteriaceae bacterium]
MLQQALLHDTQGRPIGREQRTHSADWDEVRDFCNRVYMPFRVIPVIPRSLPDAVMHSAEVGRITVTRFSYGVPVRLDRFDPGAGKILVLTTLAGRLRHATDGPEDVYTTAGDSFVVDCSRVEHRLEGDPDHLQLNLTVPHELLEETSRRWLGVVPDDRLWRCRWKFGGTGSAWAALLHYMARSIAEAPDRVRTDRIGAHLEEMICCHLLRSWAEGAGVRLDGGCAGAAPRYVRAAEAFMRTHAVEAPTIGEVAEAVGVSARTLSGGFRRFRDMTPRDFLREQRLLGVRDALARAAPRETVAAVASRWGYVNFGIFADAYRRRFGERPSDTLTATAKR